MDSIPVRNLTKYNYYECVKDAISLFIIQDLAAEIAKYVVPECITDRDIGKYSIRDLRHTMLDSYEFSSGIGESADINFIEENKNECSANTSFHTFEMMSNAFKIACKINNTKVLDYMMNHPQDFSTSLGIIEAYMSNNIELTKRLLKYGAHPMSIWGLICKRNDVDMASFALDFAGDVNDYINKTKNYESTDILELLRSKGANPEYLAEPYFDYGVPNRL